MATKIEHDQLEVATDRVGSMRDKLYWAKKKGNMNSIFELRDLEYLIACADALQYYAHPDHYEPFRTLGGDRKPGVLTERGEKARLALVAK